VDPARLAHYDIVAEIGRGVMGRVYRARDSRLGREVALKLLRPELACDAVCRARFEREARSVAALNHPNIVTVYAVEEDGDDRFLAMELVRGESLGARLVPGGMSLDDVLELALPVCDAVGAAHGQGIVHCDLKPGNVMVDESGQVKVLDFGLARAVTAHVAPEGAAATVVLGSTTTSVPASELFAGTLPYMSPEQLDGAELGPASDVFSLGVVLYEMATGERPFTGATAARLASAILEGAPPALAGRGEAADALAPVIDRCLEKDPAARFASARELRDALAEVREGGQGDGVRSARDAFTRQEWHRAFDLFRRLEGTGALAGPDFERAGEAAFWVGDDGEYTRFYERAFADYTSRGQSARAGLAAVCLAEAFYHRLAASVSRGWLKRAERLLADHPDSVEHAYLLRLQAVLAIEQARDYETGLKLAVRVEELAERHGDRDLQALGRQDHGRALIALGRVTEGMALLDEVMASAVGGELSPIVVGKSYCNMITSCSALADYRRAGEWSASAVDWCEAHSDSVFPGLCRVHRAEVLRLRGAWADAEIEAQRVSGKFADHEIVAAAVYEVGEIRLRMGDHAGAEDAFRHAHQLGRDPMPGLAALRLAQGRLDAARSLLDRSLADASRGPLDRIRLLPLRVEIALAEGDLATARDAVEGMEELRRPFESPVFEAACLQARGHLLLGEGSAGAAAVLERAVKTWNDAELPYEGARARVLLARAYADAGDTDAAELEVGAARATFARLGARADLGALAGDGDA